MQRACKHGKVVAECCPFRMRWLKYRFLFSSSKQAFCTSLLDSVSFFCQCFHHNYVLFCSTFCSRQFPSVFIMLVSAASTSATARISSSAVTKYRTGLQSLPPLIIFCKRLTTFAHCGDLYNLFSSQMVQSVGLVS